jgi:hypothetical protein
MDLPWEPDGLGSHWLHTCKLNQEQLKVFDIKQILFEPRSGRNRTGLHHSFKCFVPNGTQSYGHWSKVVHYWENRVPFRTHLMTLLNTTTSGSCWCLLHFVLSTSIRHRKSSVPLVALVPLVVWFVTNIFLVSIWRLAGELDTQTLEPAAG